MVAPIEFRDRAITSWVSGAAADSLLKREVASADLEETADLQRKLLEIREAVAACGMPNLTQQEMLDLAMYSLDHLLVVRQIVLACLEEGRSLGPGG